MTNEHREHIKEYVPAEGIEDVEGHDWKDRLRPPVDGGEEDVEAHQWVNRRIPSVTPQDEGVEEDVEGHFQPRGPWDPDQVER